MSIKINKKIVLKIGGSTLSTNVGLERICQEIKEIFISGVKLIIIHGGGKDINYFLDKQGIEPKFINGLRFTDAKTMDVVEMVLSGKVNKDLVMHLNNIGCKAVGLSGKDGNLFTAKKLLDIELGLVGEVDKSNTDILDLLISNNFLPIISPVAATNENITLNLNADYAAVAIAAAWGADELCFMTDVNGILKDHTNANSLIEEIDVKGINELINNGIITGGMIPKVDCCIKAINLGVPKVFMINGSKEGILLERILFNQNVGTTIYG